MNNEGDKAELKEKREVVIEVHFMMLQFTAVNSHDYARWKNILTCMIDKDLGSAKNHCLRVIHLYKCNLNLLLRLYMWEIDQHCEDNHLLNKSSYDKKSGRRSIAAHDKSWYIDTINQIDNSTQRVKALSAYIPYKCLGTIQEICKKQDDQFEVQLAKATSLTQVLACSNISEECPFIHWNTCFVASIAFLF